MRSHFLRRFNFFEVNKRKGNSQPLKEEEKKNKSYKQNDYLIVVLVRGVKTN